MSSARKWTRDELFVALNLYRKLSFGQLHARNPVIIELAAKMDRSANSVAMKLCNLASLDPLLRARGVRGACEGRARVGRGQHVGSRGVGRVHVRAGGSRGAERGRPAETLRREGGRGSGSGTHARAAAASARRANGTARHRHGAPLAAVLPADDPKRLRRTLLRERVARA